MLVWLTMVTGFRRGELCAIRWRHVDLVAGVLMLERSIGQRSGRTWEQDTKTRQHRRIALDPETIALLVEHRRRCESPAAALGLELTDDAFVFSLAVDGSEHLKPDSVSQRYVRLAERLGISTTIHKLRHYSATELISAGTANRVTALLSSEGLVKVSRGRRATVIQQPVPDVEASTSAPSLVLTPASPTPPISSDSASQA